MSRPEANEESGRVFVTQREKLPPGSRKIVTVGESSLGVFNVGGAYRAVLNVCPHAFAPICLGPVRGTTRPTQSPGEYIWHQEGEVIACPWHGWEFNLLSGESLVDKRRLKFFPVEIEGDRIYVVMPRRQRAAKPST